MARNFMTLKTRQLNTRLLWAEAQWNRAYPGKWEQLTKTEKRLFLNAQKLHNNAQRLLRETEQQLLNVVKKLSDGEITTLDFRKNL